MRVPLRARKCKRNCPASTVGKKSCPSCGTSAAEAVPASLASKVFQSTLEEPDYFPDTVPEAQALLAEAGFNSLPPRQLSQGFTVLEARSAPP